MDIKELYYQDSIDKQMIIHVVEDNYDIDNTMIHSEQFSLEESLCSELELRFGSCEASTVKFTVSNVISSLKDKHIVVSQYLDADRDNYYQFGIYKVVDDVPTADKSYREVTAYDKMYEILNEDVTNWYGGLTFPMTMKAFRTSFCNYVGVEQVNVELCNDTMSVEKTINIQKEEEGEKIIQTTISGKTIITAICELNGCFGHINNEGKLDYIVLKEIQEGLYPRNDLYPANTLFPKEANTSQLNGQYYNCQYEDFTTDKITGVQIKLEENDVGATIGTDTNQYVVQGNPLVYAKNTSVLESIGQNLLNTINNVSYRPVKDITAKGNPCITVGNNVRLNTRTEIVETYVLQRTLRGVQGLIDNYIANGVKRYEKNLNSVQNELISMNGRYNKLSRTLEETVSEIYNPDEGLVSKITQNAGLIASEITRATTAEGTLSSRIVQTDNAIILEVQRAKGEEEKLSASISVLDQEIDLKVDSGDVVNQINISEEAINLKGNRLIVESSNFGLDSSGNASIKGSLLYDYGDYENYEILSHDGRNRPMVQAHSAEFTDLTVTGDIIAPGMTVASATHADSAFACESTAKESHTANCFIRSSDMGIFLLPSGSSKRWKHDIENVTDEKLNPERLYDLDVKQFKFNPDFYHLPEDTEMPTVIGLIAEDVDKIYPVACEYDDETGEVINWQERYIVPAMLKLIQNQHKEIDTLKSELSELKTLLQEKGVI